MRKGTRQKLKSGDEYDLMCRKIYHPPKNGGWKMVKKWLSRRRRKDSRQDILDEIDSDKQEAEQDG